MRAARCGGQSVRLVGGNTGPGVYKDWPVDIDVLIGTTGVKELTGITNREVSSNTLRICSGSSHVLLPAHGACFSFYPLCKNQLTETALHRILLVSCLLCVTHGSFQLSFAVN